ncbi:MAG: sulfur transferase domain-containing protein, partial [Tepidisphaeraceae bacterium]
MQSWWCSPDKIPAMRPSIYTPLFNTLVLTLLLATTQFAGEEPAYDELPNFHSVNAALYRGARPKAGGMQRLAALGIRTVINLLPDPEVDAQEAAAAKTAGLQYHHVPLASIGRPALAGVEQLLALINDPANQPVFIHCKR